MIYYDIDGVLRDLHKTVWGHVPQTWSEQTHGMSMFNYIQNNLDILKNSPKTPYAEVIAKYYKDKTIQLLSSQPEKWQPNTLQWLTKNMNNVKDIDVKFTKGSNEKLPYLKEDDLLVDDSPKFKDYSKIILIHYPYNDIVLKKHKPYALIDTPEALDELLRSLIK